MILTCQEDASHRGMNEIVYDYLRSEHLTLSPLLCVELQIATLSADLAACGRGLKPELRAGGKGAASQQAPHGSRAQRGRVGFAVKSSNDDGQVLVRSDALSKLGSLYCLKFGVLATSLQLKSLRHHV